VPTTIGNIAINVADLERSERFYVDVLGLEVVTRIRTPDVEEIILGSSAGGSQLALAQHADGRTIEPGGGMWKIYLATDDSEGLFRRAVEAGAEPVAEPRHLERFKVTIAFVHDPDGHLVELGQQHLAGS
jgi:catechol 2,3-dioxygenase-like lactoylglutathione lyase family enzyme